MRDKRKLELTPVLLVPSCTGENSTENAKTTGDSWWWSHHPVMKEPRSHGWVHAGAWVAGFPQGRASIQVGDRELSHGTAVAEPPNLWALSGPYIKPHLSLACYLTGWRHSLLSLSSLV